MRFSDPSAERDGASVTQLEMQQELQRFTGAFLDRLVDAIEPMLQTVKLAERREVLRRALVYSSSALDIATGPLPEVDVLDMIVFIRLSRSVLERHWVPQVFGEPGRPLLNAFAQSEEEAWAIAARVLSAQQQETLARLTEAWERENPDRLRVEWVRLQEFSARSGTIAEQERADAKGLLGSVTAVVQVADRAVLLGERGLFLTNRLPFLMRLQARLGAQEVTKDALDGLSELDLHEGVTQGHALLQELSALAGESKQAALEARRTLESLSPFLTAAQGHRDDWLKSLDTMNQLAETSLDIVRELRQISGGEQARQSLDGLEARIDRLLKRSFAYLLVLGAAWATFFSLGHYLARRQVSKRAR